MTMGVEDGGDSRVAGDDPATPLIPLRDADLAGWLVAQPAPVRDWVIHAGFAAQAHTALRVPTPSPAILVGLGDAQGRWSFGDLPATLPSGLYALPGALEAPRATQAALAWRLGAYDFARFRSAPRPPGARLRWPAQADRVSVERTARAICLVRDLINTPANHMGPADLAQVGRGIAEACGAELRILEGEQLLAANYPLVHAVGRASDRAPQLIDLTWGDPDAPKVTLVGKGVCFDTGGLNLKPAAAMLLMKKDMGGAAHALALGGMVMEAQLPVRLRILIPAVDNVVAGNAMRPLDVIHARNGLAVEIGHTDAEGRLILADALAEASRERPDLLIDFATLTSAARAALGPDLPSLFCNDDQLARELEAAAAATADPLWRLPLWRGYDEDLVSANGALTNNPPRADQHAGAIYAALFLQRFVQPGVSWIHLDTFAWNLKARPGRPIGGEAFNLLAVFELLEGRFRYPAATERAPRPADRSSNRSVRSSSGHTPKIARPPST
jgi:leucyl aminopeptidase